MNSLSPAGHGRQPRSLLRSRPLAFGWARTAATEERRLVAQHPHQPRAWRGRGSVAARSARQRPVSAPATSRTVAALLPGAPRAGTDQPLWSPSQSRRALVGRAASLQAETHARSHERPGSTLSAAKPTRVITAIAGAPARSSRQAWLDRGDPALRDCPATAPDRLGGRPSQPGLAAWLWPSLPEVASTAAVGEAPRSGGPPWTSSDNPWTPYLPEVIDEAVAAAQQMVWQVIRGAC